MAEFFMKWFWPKYYTRLDILKQNRQMIPMILVKLLSLDFLMFYHVSSFLLLLLLI